MNKIDLDKAFDKVETILDKHRSEWRNLYLDKKLDFSELSKLETILLLHCILVSDHPLNYNKRCRYALFKSLYKYYPGSGTLWSTPSGKYSSKDADFYREVLQHFFNGRHMQEALAEFGLCSTITYFNKDNCMPRSTQSGYKGPEIYIACFIYTKTK